MNIGIGLIAIGLSKASIIKLWEVVSKCIGIFAEDNLSTPSPCILEDFILKWIEGKLS